MVVESIWSSRSDWRAQLDDVEEILLEMERDVGGGLVVAYIEQEGDRWFSCLIDPDDEGNWRVKDSKGRLTPKWRIELP